MDAHLPLAGQAVLLAYLVVAALLVAAGVHRYVLVAAARRSRHAPASAPALAAVLPVVTVQLPIFNERNVVERLLAAAADLDWPPERLEIQVLDDSTDETSGIAAREVARLRARGVDVVHLRRPGRRGFKAGALAHGLERARGELIAVFDADFVPPRHFLRQAAGHFADPRVGLVQARWGHLNRRYSLLTRVQALLLDGHFQVEQAARAARGRFFNFNGTAGIWRRSAIEQAGGWQADTLTEDLDLSYRAQLAGWRFVYRDDLVADAELPVEIDAFKGQQHRWAKGSVQSAVKLLPALLRAPLPAATKVEATFHLCGNFAYPLLLLLALLAGPVLEVRYRTGPLASLALDLPLFLLGTASVATFYAQALRQAHPGRLRWLLLLPLMALGIGMSVNNTRAVVEGLWGEVGEFRRTPKLGARDRARGLGPRRYRARRSAWMLLELALAVYFVILVARALGEGVVLALPFLLLFAAGFGWVALLSLRPGTRAEAARASRSEPAFS